jgi:hypothetical protein
MQRAHGTSAESATDAGHFPAPAAAADVTFDDLVAEFGDRWEISRITAGYRAVIRETAGRTPIPRYGRTPGELAESIRCVERQP